MVHPTENKSQSQVHVFELLSPILNHKDLQLRILRFSLVK